LPSTSPEDIIAYTRTGSLHNEPKQNSGKIQSLSQSLKKEKKEKKNELDQQHTILQ
jgi:hypothetical protein